MERVTLDHFNKLKPFTISMEQFHSNLSDENYQDASTYVTHFRIILKFILTKGVIAYS